MTESTKPQTSTKQAEADGTQSGINLAELLTLADKQAEQTAERKPNTAKLYASGRINFADGGYIKDDTKYTAKIADSTLILYEDANAKRKTNRKTDSTDILYNLVADLRKRNAYTQAVENSKTDGSKVFKDYTITKQELNAKEYYLIDLTEHEPQAEAEADGQADESQAEQTDGGTDEQTDGTADEQTADESEAEADEQTADESAEA